MDDAGTFAGHVGIEGDGCGGFAALFGEAVEEGWEFFNGDFWVGLFAPPVEGGGDGGHGADHEEFSVNAEGSSEELRVWFWSVGAEGEDVGGSTDVEELADFGSGEEHSCGAVDEAGHHGCALTEAELFGGGWGDVSRDDVGV